MKKGKKAANLERQEPRKHDVHGTGGTTGGRHEPQTTGHRAGAHGIAPRIPTDLPDTREELLALHALERRRRAAAPLGGDEFHAAAERIAEIEIHLARIERRQDPPRV
jgi:hypothetical protein